MEIRIGIWTDKPGLFNALKVKKKLQESNIQVVLKEYKIERGNHTGNSGFGLDSNDWFANFFLPALKKNEIDVALVPAHKVPVQGSSLYSIAAITERQDPRDVLVSFKDWVDFDNYAKPIRISVTSARAFAMMQHFLPHCILLNFPGDIQTALQSLDQDESDGILLSHADAKAYGLENNIIRKMNATIFTPSPGDGIFALLEMEGNQGQREMLSGIHHKPSAAAFHAELSFRDEFTSARGSIPFALATETGTGLSLDAGFLDPDGKRILRQTLSGTASNDSEARALGLQMAKLIQKNNYRKVLYG